MKGGRGTEIAKRRASFALGAGAGAGRAWSCAIDLPAFSGEAGDE